MERTEIGNKLGVALAARLSAVVPPLISVQYRDGSVTVSANDISWSAGSAVRELVDQPCDLAKAIEIAAWNALDTIQDFVTEVLRTPWPSSDESLVKYGRSYLPPANAVVEGNMLNLCFGEKSDPVMLLPGIRLSEVMVPSAFRGPSIS